MCCEHQREHRCVVIHGSPSYILSKCICFTIPMLLAQESTAGSGAKDELLIPSQHSTSKPDMMLTFLFCPLLDMQAVLHVTIAKADSYLVLDSGMGHL